MQKGLDSQESNVGGEGLDGKTYKQLGILVMKPRYFMTISQGFSVIQPVVLFAAVSLAFTMQATSSLINNINSIYDGHN